MAFSSASTADVFEIFPTGDTASCNEEFENVANSLQPGDELILNDGIYSQGCARRININGTAQNPIIIRAADGASPLITRPPETGSQNNNIELSGSFYTIRGLRFQHGSAGVRFMGSNNITFEENEIFDTLNNALTMNSGSTDSHIIRNNHIHDTGKSTGSTEGEGMYIGHHNGGSTATNHLIEGNHIHHLRATSSGGNDGIEIKYESGGNIIRGNLIHDTNIDRQYPCIFAYGHGAEPNIIEDNIVYNCGEAILVTADAVIRNNVILNSSVNGIHLRVQSPAPNIQNVTIVNNTVAGTHPICARLRIGTAPNVVVANNAFYCENSTAVSGDGFANATVLNNYVAGGMSGTSVDSAAFFAGGTASNAFADASADNYHLKAGSVLIDAGDSSIPGISTTDLDGNARIAGAGIDVGAYEFDSTVIVNPPTVSITGPASVESGMSAQLSWSSTNASSCQASGAWSGAKNTSGSEQSAALTTDSTFTLTCTGSGGTATDSVTVAVTQPTPAPTLQLSAPDSVNAGEFATLSWQSANAASCIASGGWTGSKALSGTESVGPINTAAAFTLTCSGTGRSVEQTVIVNVIVPSDDTDNDGLLDSWEISHFGNLAQDSGGDPDSDSANNGQEQTLLTDPNDADSDDDGLNDGEEILRSTNPLAADTDGDGVSDFNEVQSGSDPNDSTSVPVTQPPPVVDDGGEDDAGSGGTGLWSLILLMIVAVRRRHR